MVAPAIIGGAIAAGGSLLGGFFGDKAESKPYVPDYTHLQKGVQWRVKDAREAGIHPVYAMGFNPGSPAIVGGGGSGPSPMGPALASMGQNIGAAIASLPPQEQRNWTREQMQMSREMHRARMAQISTDVIAQQARASAGALISQRPETPPLPETLHLPHEGRHETGRTSPQQALEDEYGSFVAEPYGVYRFGVDRFNNRWVPWYLSLPRKRPKMIAPGVWR